MQCFICSPQVIVIGNGQKESANTASVRMAIQIRLAPSGSIT